MKLATFFISSTRRIFTKPLDISESSIIIKVRLRSAFFVALLTSFSSYLQRKTFAWKQDNIFMCNIFKTL